MRRLIPDLAAWSIAALLLAIAIPTQAVTIGFVEDFPGTSEGNWQNNDPTSTSNPGTGGTLGVGDGYLRIARSTTDPNGAHSTASAYAGDWLTAGAKIRFALNDVETDEPFEIHFVIGNPSNFWLYNVGFSPPENAWGTFEVTLSDSTQWTQIIPGPQGFAAAMQSVDRVSLRHDVPPFSQAPVGLVGQFGIDHIEILGSGVGVDPPGPIAGTTEPVWLAPPFPNPARGAVACAVETNAAGTLRFTILDARGRVVRTASLEAASPGRQLWMWDGLDDRGARVAAGAYRVRVVGAGGGTSRSLVRID
jgi:hypothetical protein